MVLVKAEGVAGVIAKVAAVDEDAAGELLRFALYEALCDEVDRVRPQYEADVAHFVRKTLDEAARTQVGQRPEVAKALAIAKSDFTPDDRSTRWYDGRRRGRFATQNPDGTPGPGRPGSQMVQGTATGRVTDMLERATRPVDQNLQNKGQEFWDRASEGKYSRMALLGSALTNAPNAEAQMAGTALRIAAALGPEAQNVLEPGIRRTAYRYRGTERRPSRDLAQGVAEVASLKPGPEVSAELEVLTQMRAGQPGRGVPQTTLSPAAAALLRSGQYKGNPDRQRINAVADYLAIQLRHDIPSVQDARLSLEAGKMPPSRGVIVNAQGQVVSEAMGFNGDHYLPFDLKNLKALRGGQYVRTRTTGGLTDEDIYTGLLTGARAVTVVSHSGVFTLEFDPALRGGRRYNDKARQMVGRYRRLIEAIDSEDVERTPLPKETIQALKDQIPAGLDPAIAETRLKEAIKTEKLRAKFEGIDEEEIEAYATAQADREWRQGQTGNKPTTSAQTAGKTKRELIAQYRQQALEQQYSTFRLDGDGYTAAQNALQTEFPFFIRDQRAEPLRDFLEDRKQLEVGEERPRRPGRDMGRTKARALAPTEAKNPDLPKRQQRVGSSVTRQQAANQAPVPPTPGTNQAPAPQQGVQGAPQVPAGAIPGQQGQQPASQPGQTPAVIAAASPVFQREFIAQTEPVLALANNLLTADVQPTWSAEDAAAQSGGLYLKWLLRNGLNPQVSQHLLTSATPQEMAKLKQAIPQLRAEQAQVGDQLGVAPEAVDVFEAMVAKIDAIKQPFAEPHPSGDHVRTPASDKPPAFPEIAAAVGNPSALKAVAQGMQVSTQRAQVLGMAQDFYEDLENPAAAEEIKAQVEPLHAEHERLAAFNEDPRPAPEKAAEHGMDDAAVIEAGRLLVDGDAHPSRAQLKGLQEAWALAQAARVTEWATGRQVDLSGTGAAAGGGGVPSPTPAPQPGPTPQQQRAPFSMRSPQLRRVSKQSRVVLHKADSPVARALAARLR